MTGVSPGRRPHPFIRGDPSIPNPHDPVRVPRHTLLVGHQDDRVPRAWSSSNNAMISSPVRESRLPVGSSARMIDGRVTSARATATRCRWPPDISLGL
jgi:hypothetical protein